MVGHLKRKCRLIPSGENIDPENIGIVTPYLGQKSVLEDKLEAIDLYGVEVGTVEKYQGREKDIIIVSMVRNNRRDQTARTAIGFLDNEKRMNVAISRPRKLLIVFGSEVLLETVDN